MEVMTDLAEEHSSSISLQAAVAAISASGSRKRAQSWFHQNPLLIPPPEDADIRQASMQRRRQYRYHSQNPVEEPVNNNNNNLINKKNNQEPSTAIISISNTSINNNQLGDDQTTQELPGTLTLHSSNPAAVTPSSSSPRKVAGIGEALRQLVASGESSSESPASPSGTALALPHQNQDGKTHNKNRILVKAKAALHDDDIPTPTWHAPWKLSTVLSSHLGWVRCIAFDPVSNRLMATGSADRTIKIWNFAAASVGADSALQLTLTGHISPVRGLAFSDRHPYLFSCGEDKQVKCWDLETNQVVRHYHGHLSGIFCLALHPLLDVLVTGGRDAVARVWDIRSKNQIHCLTGHSHTVGTVLCQATHPAVITGSHDATIKLWDLAAGKSMTTLTHHQKSIRSLTKPSFEHTFVSGAPDALKKWQAKDGKFIRSMMGHRSIIHAVTVNDDGVLVSGGDDGSMYFWDYRTGYNFQRAQAQVQPGSLQAENAVLALAFDGTGTRLVTGEADKTIKIWKPDDEASPVTHPVDLTSWRREYREAANRRY